MTLRDRIRGWFGFPPVDNRLWFTKINEKLDRVYAEAALDGLAEKMDVAAERQFGETKLRYVPEPGTVEIAPGPLKFSENLDRYRDMGGYFAHKALSEELLKQATPLERWAGFLRDREYPVRPRELHACEYVRGDVVKYEDGLGWRVEGEEHDLCVTHCPWCGVKLQEED